MANHQKKKAVLRPDHSIEASSFEGIMPDPETLEALEKLAPGCSQKWMDLAESEIRSRQTNESRITWTFKTSTIMGQILGFISSLVVAAVGCFAIYMGHAISGATIITGSMAAVIAAFYFRSKGN